MRHLCIGVFRFAIGILSFMTTPAPVEDRNSHPKGPNFPLIVALAGITLVLLMIAAVIFLAVRGKKDLPLNHQQHSQASNMPMEYNVADTAKIYRGEVILPFAFDRNEDVRRA